MSRDLSVTIYPVFGDYSIKQWSRTIAEEPLKARYGPLKDRWFIYAAKYSLSRTWVHCDCSAASALNLVGAFHVSSNAVLGLAEVWKHNNQCDPCAAVVEEYGRG